jgi:hypothetical protein
MASSRLTALRHSRGSQKKRSDLVFQEIQKLLEQDIKADRQASAEGLRRQALPTGGSLFPARGFLPAVSCPRPVQASSWSTNE